MMTSWGVTYRLTVHRPSGGDESFCFLASVSSWLSPVTRGGVLETALREVVIPVYGTLKTIPCYKSISNPCMLNNN